MAQHRKRFVEGSKQNGIDPVKAEKIFDLMEKFGGYGFNKSHSAAYALIAFQTAYLKAHYPVEFMASLLTSEMHSTDGVVKYIAECRSHGITVLPPDINNSGREFTVTGSEIRFGLVAVKNVGEGAIESIVSTRKDGQFASLFEFCERVDLKKTNKRVLENLVRCGAFDSTGDRRSQMLVALEEAIEYGQRVQKKRNDPQLGLFDDGENKQEINPPVLPDIHDLDEKQLLVMEKEALGFYITGHPLGRYEDLIEKFTNANTMTLKEKNDGEAVRIGGIVTSIKAIKTRRGDDMAFVTTEDLHGVVEITVFSSVYESAAVLLAEDNPVLIEGRLQKEENSVKILAESVIPMDKAEETWTAVVHLNLDITRTDRSKLIELNEIMKKHSGSCPAFIHLLNPGKSKTDFVLPDNLKVKASPVLSREINGLFGYHVLETECSPATANGLVRKGKYKHA